MLKPKEKDNYLPITRYISGVILILDSTDQGVCPTAIYNNLNIWSDSLYKGINEVRGIHDEQERKSNFHCWMDRINVKEEKVCYLRTPDILL